MERPVTAAGQGLLAQPLPRAAAHPPVRLTSVLKLRLFSGPTSSAESTCKAVF